MYLVNLTYFLCSFTRVGMGEFNTFLYFLCCQLNAFKIVSDLRSCESCRLLDHSLPVVSDLRMVLRSLGLG